MVSSSPASPDRSASGNSMLSAVSPSPSSDLSSANRPDFWDLDSDPRPIAHHQDALFLVAMCENDGSSPDAIRGGVRTDLLVARGTNINRSYSAYVTAMISNMTGSIETRRILGLEPLNPNEDDLFETVQTPGAHRH